VITQCSIRHLYAAKDEPGVSYLIDKAKTYERRRCGHRPEDHAEPLSAKECITSVVDPKDSKTNKHRYVIASQDLDVRRDMRSILGVPLIYINRSVMIMEPMADATAGNREREEKSKFRDGLKRGSGSLKRKRDDEEGDKSVGDEEKAPKKSKQRRGPKEPNPLSVKKKKPKVEAASLKAVPKESKKETGDQDGDEEKAENVDGSGATGTGKRKRKRKHKVTAENKAEGDQATAGDEADGAEDS